MIARLAALAVAALLAYVPAAGARVIPPPTPAAFDYQLGGPYTPPAGTRIVTRDHTASPVPGLYNVCYVNAFQSQPEQRSYWLKHHKTLLLKRSGKLVGDPGWPGEYLLDTSTSHRRAALARIVGRWIDDCARKGFQAVEPDNLDSWTRSKRKLHSSSNFAYAKWLIRRAHARGLAIAQKNASEQAAKGRKLGFDFAVAEGCQVYSECDQYTSAYGNEVLEIEYSDEGGVDNFQRACADHGSQISIVYRDVDLVRPHDDGYAFARC